MYARKKGIKSRCNDSYVDGAGHKHDYQCGNAGKGYHSRHSRSEDAYNIYQAAKNVNMNSDNTVLLETKLDGSVWKRSGGWGGKGYYVDMYYNILQTFDTINANGNNDVVMSLTGDGIDNNSRNDGSRGGYQYELGQNYGTININGANSVGIFLHSGTSAKSEGINENGASINVYGDGSVGIRVNKGHGINNGVITVGHDGSSNSSTGMTGSGAKSNLTNNGNMFINSDNSEGMVVTNSAGAYNNAGAHIYVNGDNSIGMNAAIGSKIINYNDIEVTGDNSIAMRGAGTANNKYVNKDNITMSGDGDTAMLLLSNAEAKNNGFIEIDGDDSYGAHASSSSIFTNNGNITITSENSTGVYLDRSTVNTNGNIFLEANNETGIYGGTSSKINSDGVIEISSNSSYGIYANDTTKVENSGDINMIDGINNDVGMYIYNAIATNSGDIYINGSNSIGVEASTASITSSGDISVNDGTNNTAMSATLGYLYNYGEIIINSDYSYGMNGTSSTVENMENITINSMNSVGLIAVGGTANYNNGTVEVNGNSSIGAEASSTTVANNGNITIVSGNSVGMNSFDDGLVVNNANITANNNNDIAMSSEDKHTYAINYKNIYLNGDNDIGIFDDNDSNGYNYDVIDIFGDDSVGMLSTNNAIGNNYGHIDVNGSSDGMVAVNNGTVNNYNKIYLNGNNSIGIYAVNDSIGNNIAGEVNSTVTQDDIEEYISAIIENNADAYKASIKQKLRKLVSNSFNLSEENITNMNDKINVKLDNIFSIAIENIVPVVATVRVKHTKNKINCKEKIVEKIVSIIGTDSLQNIVNRRIDRRKKTIEEVMSTINSSSSNPLSLNLMNSELSNNGKFGTEYIEISDENKDDIVEQITTSVLNNINNTITEIESDIENKEISIDNEIDEILISNLPAYINNTITNHAVSDVAKGYVKDYLIANSEEISEDINDRKTEIKNRVNLINESIEIMEDSTNGGLIAVSSDNSYGAYAENNSVINNYSGAVITVNFGAVNSIGMFANDNSQVNNNGEIDVNNVKGLAMGADNNSSAINNKEIYLNNANNTAMSANNNSKATNNYKIVLSNGDYGIVANNNSNGFNNGILEIDGDEAYGMVSNNNSFVLNADIINVHGSKSYGVAVDNDSIGENNKHILVDGSYSYGMSASNESVINNGDSDYIYISTIDVEGKNSVAMHVENNSTANNYYDINTNESNDTGMEADNNSVANNYKSVRIEGDDSSGMSANYDSLIYNEGQIEILGDNSYGMSITNSSTGINNNTIVVGGEGSYGAIVNHSTFINDGYIYSLTGGNNFYTYNVGIYSENGNAENSGVVMAENGIAMYDSGGVSKNDGNIVVSTSDTMFSNISELSIQSYDLSTYDEDVSATSINDQPVVSYGMFGENGASMVNSGNIYIVGTNSVGLYASGEGTTINDTGDIVIYGNGTSDCNKQSDGSCSSQAVAVESDNGAVVTVSGNINSTEAVLLQTNGNGQIVFDPGVAINSNSSVELDGNFVFSTKFTNGFDDNYTFSINDAINATDGIYVTDNSTVVAQSKLYTVEDYNESKGEIIIVKTGDFTDFSDPKNMAYAGSVDKSGSSYTAIYLDNVLALEGEASFNLAMINTKGEVYTNLLRINQIEGNAVNDLVNEFINSKNKVYADNNNAYIRVGTESNKKEFAAFFKYHRGQYTSTPTALDFNLSYVSAGGGFIDHLNKKMKAGVSFIYMYAMTDYETTDDDNDRNGFYASMFFNYRDKVLEYFSDLSVGYGKNDMTRNYGDSATGGVNSYENKFDDYSVISKNKLSYTTINIDNYKLKVYAGVGLGYYGNMASGEDTLSGSSEMALNIGETDGYSILPAIGLNISFIFDNIVSSVNFEGNYELGNIYDRTEDVYNNEGIHSYLDDNDDADSDNNDFNLKIGGKIKYNNFIFKGLSIYAGGDYEVRYDYYDVQAGVGYDF